jgi:TonB family protein
MFPGLAAAAPKGDKTPEPPITATGPEGEFLKAVHARVHRRWADNFLAYATQKLPPNNPVNDPTRLATYQIVLSGDGQLASAKLIKSSGFLGFDDAAAEVLRDSVPFPRAPIGVRSDDGTVRLRWSFARDARRCSGIALERFEEPLEVAAPKLLKGDRPDEVVRRVSAARAGGAPIEPLVTTMARSWLKAMINTPSFPVRGARLLAEEGDSAAIKWLQIAVKRPEIAVEASEALAAKKIPVCPLVKAAFGSQNWADQQNAALSLQASGEPDCQPGLIALLKNEKAGAGPRAAAAAALGAYQDEAARNALTGAARDASPTVKAAAILASVRPGSGRAKMLGLAPHLRDPAAEVRAAAAAGMVRAGGDAALPELAFVLKDPDPRPAEAVALECAKLKTEESGKFLAALLERRQPQVQIVAARALVQRRDRERFSALGRFLDPKIDKSTPELFGLALVAADPATLDRMLSSARYGLSVYRARLARGEREAAATWLLANLAKLPPPRQTEVVLDWLTTQEPATPETAVAPTAAGTAETSDKKAR